MRLTLFARQKRNFLHAPQPCQAVRASVGGRGSASKNRALVPKNPKNSPAPRRPIPRNRVFLRGTRASLFCKCCCLDAPRLFRPHVVHLLPFQHPHHDLSLCGAGVAEGEINGESCTIPWARLSYRESQERWWQRRHDPQALIEFTGILWSIHNANFRI